MAFPDPLPSENEPKTLRDLSLPIRLVLALFLVSVGYGYLSALVQLHFKEATPGELLPTMEDVVRHYHGEPGKGQLERIITAPESLPFSSGGSMRSAFTHRSAGWTRKVRQFAEAREIGAMAAEKSLRLQRALEADAIVAWIHEGAKKETYESFPIPASKATPFDAWLTSEKQALKEGQELEYPSYFAYDEEKKQWTAEVSAILEDRCARCHFDGGGGPAGKIHLDSYENVMDYIPPLDDMAARGTSLSHLAQSTHVHLLGFSMLYGLTGLLFAFTSYPIFVRVLIAPLPLLAQIIDISFWWLARLEEPYGPQFAMAIPISGGIVGLGLMLQIVLGLFALFGWFGRFVLVLLIASVATAGHLYVKPIVDKQLQYEKETTLPTSVGVK